MSRERELLERAYQYIPMSSVTSQEIRAYLHPAPEPTQDEEPVAFISKNGFRFNADIEPIEHGLEVPLYLHPSPQAEQRKPLTKEEVQRFWADNGIWSFPSFKEGVRFAEKHHGIGGDE